MRFIFLIWCKNKSEKKWKNEGINSGVENGPGIQMHDILEECFTVMNLSFFVCVCACVSETFLKCSFHLAYTPFSIVAAQKRIDPPECADMSDNV